MKKNLITYLFLVASFLFILAIPAMAQDAPAADANQAPGPEVTTPVEAAPPAPAFQPFVKLLGKVYQQMTLFNAPFTSGGEGENRTDILLDALGKRSNTFTRFDFGLKAFVTPETSVTAIFKCSRKKMICSVVATLKYCFKSVGVIWLLSLV